MDSDPFSPKGTELTDTVQQVRQLVSDIFAVPLERVGEDSSPETIEAWDSMQHLNLVLAVEERFNLQFTPEEMEGMRSVGRIAAMVAAKSNNASAR